MNKLEKMPLFVSLLLLLLHLILVSSQSEGDVRLAGGPKENIGRLEIFWQRKWSTFCGLSTGGAQAACRQLGFLDFVIYKALENVNPNSNISKASPETPIAIDYTECKRDFSNGLLHVLRCGYSTDISSDCNHDNDIVLQCQTTSLWTHPYETQVRLHPYDKAYLSSGTLEIFLNGEWGNVCGNGFQNVAADSACRQMGFTSALTFSNSGRSSAHSAKLDHISCPGNKSCDCLSGCFTNNNIITPITCNNKFVQLTCTYDIKIASEAPSGSQDICSNKKTSCTGPLYPTGETSLGLLSQGDVAAIVVGAIVLLVVLVSLGFIFGLCVLPSYKRRNYRAVNE